MKQKYQHNYVGYHFHSMHSNGVTNIDSVTTFEQHVEKAKSLGMKAFGFSEHGNVFEWLKKKQAIEKAGMKYIHACEMYLTRTIEEETKIMDNYHVVLIAKNQDGFEEINRLSSASFNRTDGHFYGKPRITMDELQDTSDNVIVTSACLGGVLNGNDVKDPHFPLFLQQFQWFMQSNKHRCFYEIQPHNTSEQIAYNEMLWEMSKRDGVPLIVGTDTHDLDATHTKVKKVLQIAKDVNFPDEEGFDMTFKSYDELVEMFAKQHSRIPMDDILEAIDNTNVMADMVESFEIDRTYKYPKLWDDPEKTLRQKIEEGIKYRSIESYPNYQEYLDRIEIEMDAYRHNKAFDFILLMEDVCSFCRSRNIQIGYGRGSVNGSIICWLIGITEMDSVKFKLNFERFMNTERISLADIDTDLPPSRIEEVKAYLYSKHGLYCADIITFNTIALKGAIDDICRGLYRDSETIDYLQRAKEIKAACEADEEKARKTYAYEFEYIDIAVGTIVSVGTHPCGLVCSPFDIRGAVGTCTNKNTPYPVTQLYMKEIDFCNFVKLDLLKLDTIEIIANTCKLADIPMLLPDTIDDKDEDVWRSIRDDTTEIFQWSSPSGQDYIRHLLSDESVQKFREVNPDVDKIMLLTIGNSAIRPAGASYRDDLANGIVRKTGSDVLDEFLKPTFGYLVFQCQIIEFLHEYCGFTMGEADIVRRSFAKKTGTEQHIPVIKDGGHLVNEQGIEGTHYIKGFVQTMADNYGMTKQEANDTIAYFIQVIKDASDYLFSLNHSQPYSYEGYAAGWLRYYYPLEFLTAALQVHIGEEKKTIPLIDYANKVGISIKPQKFRHSKGGYFCDKATNTIYRGVGEIKGIKSKLGDDIYDNFRYGKYETFTDLLYAFDSSGLDIKKNQLTALIELDYFEEFGNPAKLLLVQSMYERYASAVVIDKTRVEDENIARLMSKYCEKETYHTVEEINVEAYLADHPCAPELLDKIKTIRYKRNPLGERIGVDWWKWSSKKAIKVLKIPQELQWRYATRIKHGRWTNIDGVSVVREIEAMCTHCEYPLSRLVRAQMEYLGQCNYINSKLPWQIVVVSKWEERRPTFLTTYCLQNGKSCEMRIRKEETYNRHSKYFGWDALESKPIREGDILMLHSVKKLPRVKKIDGKWIELEEKQWWIPKYEVMNNLDEEALYAEAI